MRPLTTGLFLLVGCAALASPLFAGEAPSEPRTEAHDALPAGTTGATTGTIARIDGPKLLLRTGDDVLLFMPHWRGGAPKDGGGLDPAMRKRLQEFHAGDRVTITWTWQERRRIETITTAP